MKKAFLDQMFLGWLALAAVVVFVATVADERSAKNKAYDLDDVAQESINALGQEYYKNMQGNITTGQVSNVMTAICLAQTTTTNLINTSTLGNKLNSSNKISYTWRDAGTYDIVSDSYDGVPDGRPDSITATIGSYTKTNFWYKLLGKDSFEIPGFSRAADLNRFTYNVNVSFRGVIQAGYYNMVGTYTLDENGCPQNPQLVLANKDEWASKIGENLVNIEMPQTRMFFISDGYKRFDMIDGKNDADVLANTTISFDNNGSTDCTTSSDFPDVVLSRAGYTQERSDDADSDLTSKANVYFQDDYLNFDNEAEHMREIAEKDWGAFVALMEQYGSWNDEAKNYYNSLSSADKIFEGTDLKSLSGNIDKWDDFVNDRGLTPDFDENSEYVFVSEDLAATTDKYTSALRHDKYNSDFDFSDMSFSMLKIFVPDPIDPSLIESDSTITLTCP